jgi:hypothetical protein
VLGHDRGTETGHQLGGRGGVAHQRGDMSAAGPGQLYRHPPDTAGRPGDEHALAEHQAPDLERPERGQPGRGQGGGLHIGNAGGYHGQPADRDRGQLRPRAPPDQPGHPGARGRSAAIAGRLLDHASDVPAWDRSRRHRRQVLDLAAVERRDQDPDHGLIGQRPGSCHLGERDVRGGPDRREREHDTTPYVTPGRGGSGRGRLGRAG